MRISPFTPADAATLLELYQSLYPSLGWTAEAMRWQYEDNPAGAARIWLARDGDRVVASYAEIGRAHV